ncbi:MAG: RIP metalloprotease RseP [Candidatus Zambryskibacteria bacterium RIFCSPHIGHO2_02_FULL_43_14]|uniref:Zinc metalloprotease n=1 Tax=Candidatus Zambryskibacteria bacterium RIFCSPHIGHO2_02_FULL_43_14 TaxID=1802748 RepID=A0A1G2TF78_9BACT|nr:MAG: RIP metalloprotease RseP [Candidatus Zambryskibacteria bacterium RIFCSPHIGHO2_01_FULL_43_60]OHA95930.1 MAG: RIP metalloprotease RseP [Candidatus Zambryskibacteria bacterium RIFCSPHIGHO2_02_FULL_43_14]OHB03624.1 MAG: RIP metalloprotease RseP [Candidatus Zambryskibacteria bacterium RIFCSPLOWO2_01_FULL_42_41]
MSIIIFIIILSALIIVHELGHFLVAKKFGIRVDEFGLGFPPRAKELFIWKNTPFTLNWLPFGGFVKIFGENPIADEPSPPLGSYQGEGLANGVSFQLKNRGIQASVLVAGVIGNFLFAWLLISLGFITGMPAPADIALPIENARTVIVTVLPDSPAALAGLKSGDAILSLSRGVARSELTPEALSLFIAQSIEPITFEIERGGQVSKKILIPTKNILADRPAVGISMDVIGIVKLPPHKAFWQGFKTTSELTWMTGQAIGTFIFQALGGKADFSSVTGPVGIVGMVGDVRELGFSYLMTFIALISINLAIINLLPFPALDGGRLLFVAIEGVTRRSIPPRIFNALNTAGFALLIFLMLLITFRDVRNIF